MNKLTCDPSQLDCHLPISRHPYTDSLPSLAGQWLERFCDARLAEILRQLEVAQFHELAGLTAPEVSLETLDRLNRWYLWLFLVDDVTDPAAHAKGLASLQGMHRSLLDTLDGRRPEPGAAAVARLLYDLLADFAQHGDQRYLPRLLDDTRRYLEGNAWEAYIRQGEHAPSTAVYSMLRPDAGAAYTAFDLYPLLDPRYRLGDEELEHVAFRTMRTFANLHISLVNDVCGHSREVWEGNPSNLVTIIAREEGIDPDFARILAVARCNQIMRDYSATEQAWRELVTPTSVEADAYVRMMGQWIAGSLHWHRTSRRYTTTHVLAVGQDR